jgi:hypothetical protein
MLPEPTKVNVKIVKWQKKSGKTAFCCLSDFNSNLRFETSDKKICLKLKLKVDSFFIKWNFLMLQGQIHHGIVWHKKTENWKF